MAVLRSSSISADYAISMAEFAAHGAQHRVRVLETTRTDQPALRLSGLSYLPQALFHLTLGRVGL